MKTQGLHLLTPGAEGIVYALYAEGSIRRRLLDMGLTEGCHVRCLLESPGSDMRAYLIRGALVSIRKKDAEKILIYLPEQEDEEGRT